MSDKFYSSALDPPVSGGGHKGRPAPMPSLPGSKWQVFDNILTALVSSPRSGSDWIDLL
jgi:hypothetical protein